MNIPLKAAILEKFGSQILASRKLGFREQRLSYLIQGWGVPNDGERRVLKKALKKDYFNQESPQEAR